MNSKSTSIFDYNVKIVELFKENEKIASKVQMTAENEKNWLIKYYDVKGNFNEYIYDIIPKFKKAILEMERELNGYWFYNINSIINSLYNITRIKNLFRLRKDN